MLSNKTRGKFGKGATARGLAGYWSVGAEQLFSFASLVFLGFYFSLFLIFLFITFFVIIIIIILFQLLNCFYLNPQVSSHLPF